MALPGPEQCLERTPGFPCAVVVIWALLQHHWAIFFFLTELIPEQLRGKGERGNWDCQGVATLWTTLLMQPLPGTDQCGVRVRQ